MYILGINGTPNQVHHNYYGFDDGSNHDSGAALLYNGELVAAFEEERLNRIKHTNKWPTSAMAACLEVANISIDQIDRFALPIPEEQLKNWLDFFYGVKGIAAPSPRSFIQRQLEDQFQTDIDIEEIDFFEHHHAHAVTAFYPSDFDKALVMTIDGAGGMFSGSIHVGTGNEMEMLKTFSIEQSLGHFYNKVTNLLGFAPNFDEYKVMGLAPYGDPKRFKDLFSEYYTLLPAGDYKVRTNDLDEIKALCNPQSKNDGFDQTAMDLAASLQETLETIVDHILDHYQRITDQPYLCMSGGVALNCTMNGKIFRSGRFEDIFVYPGASDSGLPVGAALASYYKHDATAPRAPMHSMYVGTQIPNENEIKQELEQWQDLISFERIDNVEQKTAQLLSEGKVFGWVQGRSEFAPRALGNRSIIADPRPEENQTRINSIVKKRESFRPFAPSVLEEYVTEFFDIPKSRKDFGHMIYVFDVAKQYQEVIKAVTHVDGSARIQTVSWETNPRYWKLIDHFRQITDVPIILNTSFNNNVEPMVDSVTDSIVCYLTTDLDHLVVEDFLISKKVFSIKSIEGFYPQLPLYFHLNRSIQGETQLTNSYNDKKVNLTEMMFDLMDKFDGTKPLKELLDSLALTEKNRELVLKEIVDRWGKRQVILIPTPTKNNLNLQQQPSLVAEEQ